MPLDFSSKECNLYRGSKNFVNVLRILNYYNNKQNRPLLRIGTVVTKENIKDLKNIAELLKNHKIDLWKIYQFTPIGINAVINKEDLEIDLATFKKETSLIKAKCSKYFKIVASERNDRASVYFLINPDGTVFIPTDNIEVCKEVVIGNIFNTDIISKWKNLISETNYINNIKVTFNYKFEKKLEKNRVNCVFQKH